MDLGLGQAGIELRMAYRLRGRAFSVVMSVGYAVLGIGMVAAGPLTNALGARAVWGIASGLLAVAAVVGFGLLRGVSEERARTEVVPSHPVA